MKRMLISLSSICFFLIMLSHPSASVDGASRGLLLWFQIILPTLLPFMILSDLLLETHAVDLIASFAGKLFRRIFHVSSNGAYVVLIGFLCGYPMGGKTASDLLTRRQISYSEACYLLSFCNNTSPMFIISFLIDQNLNLSKEMIPITLILLGAPVLCSFLFRRFYFVKSNSIKTFQSHSAFRERKDKADPIKVSENVMDRCIMKNLEAIVKIGVYMMLFSMLMEYAVLIPVSEKLQLLFTAPLEITTGIVAISKSSLSFPGRFISCLALTSFGGLCSVAQTWCMIQKRGLSIKIYIIQKLITAGVTSLLAFGYYFFIR